MGVGPGWKMFAWVPDGIYDHQAVPVRYIVVDGMPTHQATRSWIEQGLPSDAVAELRPPWGTYPDFPPKPEKK